MNPRIRYSQKFDRLINLVDGAEFHFIPNNPESKAKALAALDAHGTKVIAALEQFAGPLSDLELLHGVSHKEYRTPAQQIADAQPEPTPRFDSNESSPYAKALEMGLGEPTRKESKTEMYQRLDKSWRDKKQAEAEQAAFNADEKRQRAVAHARAERDALKYDPNASAQEVEEADNRLALAVTGDLAQYAQADREWRAAKQAKIDAQTAEVDAQIQALRERKHAIATKAYEPPPPPQATPTPHTFPKVNADSPEYERFAESRRQTEATFNLTTG